MVFHRNRKELKMKHLFTKRFTLKNVFRTCPVGLYHWLPGVSQANMTDHVSDSVLKMTTCGFNEPDELYSACLALQHPDRIGDSERWNIRGTICNEVKQQMGGTGGWDPTPYNSARALLEKTDCDEAAQYVGDSVTKVNSCGFTEPADVYSQCLALQHPDRIGDSDRWNLRGTICNEVKRQMGGTGGWNSASYNEARDTIAETDCDHTGAHVFDSIDKMRACGFTNPADIYSVRLCSILTESVI